MPVRFSAPQQLWLEARRACTHAGSAVPRARGVFGPTAAPVCPNTVQRAANSGHNRAIGRHPRADVCPANGDLSARKATRLKIVVSPVRVRVSPFRCARFVDGRGLSGLDGPSRVAGSSVSAPRCASTAAVAAAGSPQTSTPAATATVQQVRDAVREKYVAAAVAATAGAACCGPADGAGIFGAALYAGSGEPDVPEAAVSASLGCGVPTAVADLLEGETVLDLGSGAGADVLISARRTGEAIGLDMTDEMLKRVGR
jgi:hypothetical protein